MPGRQISCVRPANRAAIRSSARSLSVFLAAVQCTKRRILHDLPCWQLVQRKHQRNCMLRMRCWNVFSPVCNAWNLSQLSFWQIQQVDESQESMTTRCTVPRSCVNTFMLFIQLAMVGDVLSLSLWILIYEHDCFYNVCSLLSRHLL